MPDPTPDSRDNNGGPAFPQGELDATNDYALMNVAAHCGMSLRDYFAAKVFGSLQIADAILCTHGRGDHLESLASLAESAFKAADAMLAARKAGGQ